MILVTLGTNDKSFVRLIQKIEDLIVRGIIKEEVVVQAGYTKYETEHMKIFDLIPMDKFQDLMENCSLLITHGGVGTIISGLTKDKKVIAIPRLKKYGEHVNDHQLQIIENFSESGYILASYEVKDLEYVLSKAHEFEPQKYESNTNHMIELVRTFIDGV